MFADELLLSAPQPLFKDMTVLVQGHPTYTFSHCSLLHRLLITGQGEQVVSRRGELNRDLLSKTCEYEISAGRTVSKVKCRVRLKCRLEIEILDTYLNQNNRNNDG